MRAQTACSPANDPGNPSKKMEQWDRTLTWSWWWWFCFEEGHLDVSQNLRGRISPWFSYQNWPKTAKPPLLQSAAPLPVAQLAGCLRPPLGPGGCNWRGEVLRDGKNNTPDVEKCLGRWLSTCTFGHLSFQTHKLPIQSHHILILRAKIPG